MYDWFIFVVEIPLKIEHSEDALFEPKLVYRRVPSFLVQHNEKKVLFASREQPSLVTIRPHRTLPKLEKNSRPRYLSCGHNDRGNRRSEENPEDGGSRARRLFTPSSLIKRCRCNGKSFLQVSTHICTYNSTRTCLPIGHCEGHDIVHYSHTSWHFIRAPPPLPSIVFITTQRSSAKKNSSQNF